ncbi:MAG: dNTP triphosphohydrolase, partial [Methanobrevibacter sp.]|nr:dNTP triphosphohydrolase [Methanobrevibacter sp.]
MYEINQEMITKTRKLINDNFAQVDSEKDRFHQENNRNHLGEEFEKYSIRNEFSRDSDRIIYSKAFRRLEHKAQVYSNKRGDHYRTRLTHTLEVTQIARSISRNLGLNEQLAEAIALGHDIGHTPFGHAGEAVLDDIMRGKDDLGGKLEFNIDYGGFKHNFNCLKILEIVEKREKRIGLNLTWQTLDGILKHTKVIKGDKKWNLSRFVRDISKYENIIKYDYFDNESKPTYEHPLTLEGQVVAISDEIAQREHDLDDSLRDGDLFRFEDMFNEIIKIIDEISKGISIKNPGYNLFCSFNEKIHKLYNIENHKKWKELTSIIISYFIIDVTENTIRKINEYETFDHIVNLDEKNGRYIKEKIIDFSETGEKVNEKIDEFIKHRIIYSFNVSRFDGKGKFILRQLFKAYYENPRQMPKKQLIILIKKIEQVIIKYPQLKEKFDDYDVTFEEDFTIDETNVDISDLDPLLDIL